jgi:hypothetical protein
MSTTTTVPLSATPEAAAHIAKLGMQREFDLMIEHARQTAPSLRSIAVTLEDRYDLGGEPVIVIESTVDSPLPQGDSFEWQCGGWQVRVFPADVCRHFVMLAVYGRSHGR